MRARARPATPRRPHFASHCTRSALAPHCLAPHSLRTASLRTASLRTASLRTDAETRAHRGVLLVVSHDRYFLDKVVDHCFVLPGDGVGVVLDWQASFSDYLAFREAQQQQQRPPRRPSGVPSPPSPPSPASSPPTSPTPSPASKPLSNFERQSLERLESEMEALSDERDALQANVDAFDPKRSGYSELTEWTEQIESIGAKLDEVELKWLALAERADL